jgi:hypothetical protein
LPDTTTASIPPSFGDDYDSDDHSRTSEESEAQIASAVENATLEIVGFAGYDLPPLFLPRSVTITMK